MHPFLLAAFPLLYLAVANRDLTGPGVVVVPLVTTLAATAVALLIGSRLLGDPTKAAIVLSGAAVLFFSYGHVWNAMKSVRVGGVRIGHDLVLLPIFAVAGLLILIATMRTKRRLGDLNRILNIVGLAFLVVAGTSLIQDAMDDPPGEPVFDEFAAIESERPLPARDIYYLIFDRYPDADSLRAHFGFENDAFLSELEQRGFAIANRARANYQNTHLSLTSSLNVEYLDYLRRRIGDTQDVETVFNRLGRSRVAQFLQRKGYRYVHIGSWYTPTSESPIADVNMPNAPLSEFTRTFLVSTALAPLTRAGVIGEADHNRVAYSTTTRQFASLGRATELQGPKFVFAHFLVPHPPYVFDSEGNRHPSQARLGNATGFIEQVRFTNRRILDSVDRILEQSEDAIVIVQAEEGPYPHLRGRTDSSWLDLTDGELRVKYGILNALRLPDAGDAVYPTLSPVNNFRVVFNRYFGTDLPLLDDESYASRSRRFYYRFVRLGDRVLGRPPPFRAAAGDVDRR